MNRAIVSAFLFALFPACATSPRESGVPPSAVEPDSTLTHALLILENPYSRPISVRLARPGLDRSFVVPPKSGMRQLVPAGPLQLHIGSRRLLLNLRAQMRTTYALTVDPGAP